MLKEEVRVLSIHIVLVEPEIPQNTGNIARICAVTGAVLHLVKPLGFEITDRRLKRAGLDYWDKLNVQYHESFFELKEQYKGHRFFCATTKADHAYTDFHYQDEDFFVFGKETKGLAPEILASHADTLIRIPMRQDLRSLNLANSVSIIVYEALRQRNFPQML
jgi:tRNA (cytidine/uridine-2'-O-)-methyltransferase